MSDLLNSASLVLIPSGYKEDVVYSAVPTDGSGDLSFTRASNGTRINSAGLVEVVPWNLCEQSETFDNAFWSKPVLTLTTNVTTAPNGTITADRIYAPLTENNPVIYSNSISVVASQNYAVSIYAKADGKNWIFIRTIDDAGAGVWFNLSNGTIGTQTSATGIIESVGNSWYRCTVIGAPTTTSGRCVYLVVDSNGTTTSTASGTDGIYIWGAQANIGSTAKPYFPTTDRLNVPRLTYQNGGGGCPSLLLEKQSTNLVTYSEQFDNVGWSKSNSAITANATTSPDGTTNADKIVEDTGNTGHTIYQYYASTSGTVYTLSVFAKASERTKLWMDFFGGGSIGVFDLSNGTVITTSGAGITAIIENFGNGWYRCSISQTAAGTDLYPNFGPTINNTTNPIYQGNGTSGIFLWGAQLEASSYKTSYISTTSASATRVADVCFKTGISSLIGQTEGTIFLDAQRLYMSGDRSVCVIYTSGSSYIQVYLINDIRVIVNGTVIMNGLTIAENTRYKIAIAYKSGQHALYVNGAQITTSATSIAPTVLNDLYVGNAFGTEQSGIYNQTILFPTRLTNAELASLTTL